MGTADPALTAVGLRQAAAFAEWAAGSDAVPVRIVSSTMRRARQTAEAVAEWCGLTVETDERLAEFDLGSNEYIPLEMAGAELLEHAGAALTTGVWGQHRFDPDEFRARVREGFADLVEAAGGRRTIVVCHGGVLNSYLSDVLNRPYGVFFMPRYTSVNRVHLGADGRLRIGSINELPHAHLEPDLAF